MTGTIIDGVAYAADLKDVTVRMIRELNAHGVHVGLATVMVGDDYAAGAYERRLRRLASELGCGYRWSYVPRMRLSPKPSRASVH